MAIKAKIGSFCSIGDGAYIGGAYTNNRRFAA